MEQPPSNLTSSLSQIKNGRQRTAKSAPNFCHQIGRVFVVMYQKLSDLIFISNGVPTGRGLFSCCDFDSRGVLLCWPSHADQLYYCFKQLSWTWLCGSSSVQPRHFCMQFSHTLGQILHLHLYSKKGKKKKVICT